MVGDSRSTEVTREIKHTMKNKVLAAVAALGLMLGGAGLMIAAQTFGKPKSILHIITVKWKADATAAQKDAAIKGVEKMAGQVPGLKNVWLDTIKVQPGGYNNVIVMEFADQAAFNAYADNQAHKDWEKVYLPIREASTTHDATNK